MNSIKTTILDYIDWRGDLSFKTSSFNEVDNVIFSMLIYLDFDKTMKEALSTYPTLGKGIETFFKQYDYKKYKFGVIVPNAIKDLAIKAKDSKRFQEVLILDYVKEVSAIDKTQFCAGAFLLNDGNIVIAFEGTDDSIAGWYENLYMVCEKETIAQRKAVAFVNRIANRFPGKKIILCGHSKGGNLAYYSAMFVEDKVKERLLKVYNSDGPGLIYSRYSEDKAKIIDKVGVTVVPNSAVIGSIFEMRGEIRIISSRVKNIYQHDPFELIVIGNHFLRCDKFTKSALNIQKETQKYVLSINKEDVRRCIDDIYEALYLDNKRTLMDLKIVDHNIVNKLLKLVKDDNMVIKKFAAILINNNTFMK